MGNKLIVLLAGLAVILSGAAFIRPAQIDSEKVTEVVKEVGSLAAGPDINSPYLGVNGVNRYFYSTKLNNASSTLCAFKTPAATTTILNATLKINTGTTTSAFSVDINQNNVYSGSTSTLLSYGREYFPAGARGAIVASSTSGVIFPPNSFLVYTASFAESSFVSANALGGFCKATFLEL